MTTRIARRRGGQRHQQGHSQRRGLLRTPRRGATLVEILIACIMMCVALVGLLGTSRKVAEATGATRQQIIADGVIQSRLDSLESVPCSALANGTRTTRGIGEVWTITAVGKTRQIDLAITIPRMTTPLSYRTIVPCI